MWRCVFIIYSNKIYKNVLVVYGFVFSCTRGRVALSFSLFQCILTTQVIKSIKIFKPYSIMTQKGINNWFSFYICDCLICLLTWQWSRLCTCLKRSRMFSVPDLIFKQWILIRTISTRKTVEDQSENVIWILILFNISLQITWLNF